MNNFENYYKKLIKGKNLDLLDIIVVCFLEILAIIYANILKIRNFMYNKGLCKSHKLLIPVISIGNITVGGTGKTSICITIVRMLKENNTSIAILSRGYKGSNKHSIGIVSDGDQILLSPLKSGDEPYLMAEKLPGIKILVGKNRYVTASYAQNKFQSKLIILDDGFQQRKLVADINILLVDAGDPFGNYKLLPRGILREPVNGLKKSHIIIITNVDKEHEHHSVLNKIKKIAPHSIIFTAQYSTIGVRKIKTENNKYTYISRDEIKDKSFLVVTGIAHPEYFRETVEKWLNTKTKTLYFSDHYKFKKEDFEKIRIKASLEGCNSVLITEKDAVKFKDWQGDLPLFVLEAEMKINEENDFREKLSEFIALH